MFASFFIAVVMVLASVSFTFGQTTLQPPRNLSVITNVPSSSSGQKYGVKNEICTTKGTVVTPKNDWKKALQNAGNGDIILLKKGIYKGSVTLPDKNVLVKPYNCEAVTLEGRFKLGSNNVFAGMTIRYSCGSGCHTRVVEVNGKRNVVVRNNKFANGGVNVSVGSSSKDVRIYGNDFIQAYHFQVSVRGNPTDDVTIRNNRMVGVDDDDTIQAENQRNLVIKDNYFIGNKDDQIIDIKVPRGDVTITGNLLDCRNARDSCILFHADDYAPRPGDKSTVTGNTIVGCTTGQQTWLVMGGNKTYHYRGLTVSGNTFIGGDGRSCKMVVNKCRDCKFVNNRLYKGSIRKSGRAINTNVSNNKTLTSKPNVDFGSVRVSSQN